MTALRQKWLGKSQKVLGTKLAVRVMQIDRPPVAGASGVRHVKDSARSLMSDAQLMVPGVARHLGLVGVRLNKGVSLRRAPASATP